MNVPLLDLKAQYLAMKGEIDRAVAEVMESQHFILGPQVQKCEKAIAQYSNCAICRRRVLGNRCFADLPYGRGHRSGGRGYHDAIHFLCDGRFDRSRGGEDLFLLILIPLNTI